MSSTPAKRSGRPAHLRVAPPTADNEVREQTARSLAPSHNAPLRSVVEHLATAPLGRHGRWSPIPNAAAFRTIQTTLGGDAA